MKNLLNNVQIFKFTSEVKQTVSIEYDDEILKEPLDVKKIRQFYENYFVPNWKSDYLFRKLVNEMQYLMDEYTEYQHISVLYLISQSCSDILQELVLLLLNNLNFGTHKILSRMLQKNSEMVSAELSVQFFDLLVAFYLDKQITLDVNQIKCLIHFSRFKSDFGKPDFVVVKLMKKGKSREDYICILKSEAQNDQVVQQKFKVV